MMPLIDLMKNQPGGLSGHTSRIEKMDNAD